MSDSIKNMTKLAIMEEVTEGTYLAPASGADFIEFSTDGLELTPAKEIVERLNTVNSIGKRKSRAGMRSASATIPMELKANGTAGSEPEFGLLIKGALGSKRQNTTVITTKSSGNTATVLQIEDADISKLSVGDCILVKQTGAFHVSPIISKTSGTGTATVTLLVAHPSGDITDSVTIEKFTTFKPANSGHPSISLSKYTEDAKLETLCGGKVSGMNLSGLTTGQIGSVEITLDAMGSNQSLTAPSYTPSTDTALPPIILSSLVYQNGSLLDINELSLSLANTIAWKTSTASENGRISGRVTGREITGTMNPYKESDSIAQFTKFDTHTSFSVFQYSAIPTTAGEFKDVVALYLPSCTISELAEADQDGLLQETLSFTADRGEDGQTEEMYLTFI